MTGVLSLSHPLPAGMRDLLPREAERRGALTRQLMESFELWGYQRVALPAFEYAEVLEQGLGTLDPAEVLRFVEPNTGEVVALRPDMTPQVARLLATRLADAPPPARLCYHGSVLRQRRERARRRHEIEQAGIELIGRSGPEGDMEILLVAAATISASGLSEFVVDIGHAGVVASLMQGVPRPSWPELIEALKVKDGAAVAELAEERRVNGAIAQALARLPELHGGEEIWPEAERVLGATPARSAALELKTLWEAARTKSVGARVSMDFGEIWNFNYYTGAMFQILAEGPGEALGSGGRYDGLFEKFGIPRPAAGFAVDIDNLDWALSKSSSPIPETTRVLVACRTDAESMLGALRAGGVRCASAPEENPLDYAGAWHFSHLLSVDGSGALTLKGVFDRSELSLPAGAFGLVVAALSTGKPKT